MWEATHTYGEVGRPGKHRVVPPPLRSPKTLAEPDAPSRPTYKLYLRMRSRSVLRDMPSSVAARVRFPRQLDRAERMRARSSSSVP